MDVFAPQFPFTYMGIIPPKTAVGDGTTITFLLDKINDILIIFPEWVGKGDKFTFYLVEKKLAGTD